MNLCPWNLPVPTKYTDVVQPACVVRDGGRPRPVCFHLSVHQPYSIVARHAARINLLFLAGEVQAFAGSYVGCGTGRPRS